jgi:hypothetical protein
VGRWMGRRRWSRTQGRRWTSSRQSLACEKHGLLQRHSQCQHRFMSRFKCTLSGEGRVGEWRFKFDGRSGTSATRLAAAVCRLAAGAEAAGKNQMNSRCSFGRRRDLAVGRLSGQLTSVPLSTHSRWDPTRSHFSALQPHSTPPPLPGETTQVQTFTISSPVPLRKWAELVERLRPLPRERQQPGRGALPIAHPPHL